MSKHTKIYLITTGILLIAYGLTFVIAKQFVNKNAVMAAATSYIIGLVIGHFITAIAVILEEKLKDNKRSKE